MFAVVVMVIEMMAAMEVDEDYKKYRINLYSEPENHLDYYIDYVKLFQFYTLNRACSNAMRHDTCDNGKEMWRICFQKERPRNSIK